MTTDNNYAYPQTKLRIAASYHAGKVGDVLPAGTPEQVEVEINDEIPGDVLSFVNGVIEALLRCAPDGTRVAIEHNAPAVTG